MSTVYLALRNIQPSEFVKLASNTLHFRFTDSMANADRSYWERFHVVESDAQRKREDGEFCDYRENVRHNWGMFLKEMDQVLTDNFAALVDTMVEIGSNPKYARYAVPNPPKWAHQVLQSFYSQLETLTLQKIIPPLAERLGPAESWNSLVREFQTVIDGHRGSLLETAKLNLAQWKPVEVTSDEQAESQPNETVEQPTLPAPQQAVEQSTPPTWQLPIPYSFSLVDLDDPGDLPLRLVVHEGYRFLRKTIKGVLSWKNQKTLIKQEVSYKDIAKEFPLLKDAKQEEMQDIVQSNLSPAKVARGIIIIRTGKSESTIDTYIRQPLPERMKYMIVGTSSSVQKEVP